MLTDEERNAIIDVYMNDDSSSIHGMCEAIERAVLAKAMPIPKQEPVASRRKDFMGNYVYRNEMILGSEPLYAEPQPAQAAAIPEAMKHLTDSGGYYDDCYINGWNACREAMLSASTKPE